MEATVDQVQETDEERAARIRRVRTRRALAAAPELAYQLRWDATPLDGRTEPGIWRPQLRTPLLTGITDAGDFLYARLHGWAAYWGDQLNLVTPTAYGWRGSRGEDVPELRGHAAGVTPETAHNLVTSAAAWLLWHETSITGHQDEVEYLDDVASTYWALRSAAGLNQPRRAHVKRSEIVERSSRPCPNPACRALEVEVEYFGEPMESAESRGERLDPTPYSHESDEQALNQFASAIAGVTVRCLACGWSPILTPSKIARWLTPDAINPVGPVPIPRRESLRRPGDRNYPKASA